MPDSITQTSGRKENTSMGNPNQDDIDRAYQDGVDAAENEGFLFSLARMGADLIVPDQLLSDEQKAFERGYDDAKRGNV